MLLRQEPLDIINELNNFFENNQKYRKDDTKVESSRWLPAVDIKELDDSFKLYVDIPGVDIKNIEISMEDNILVLKGNREDVNKDEKNNYHRIERIKGVFYRRFSLPDTADAEQIDARSKLGVLEITIGKKKKAQSRKIEIRSE